MHDCRCSLVAGLCLLALLIPVSSSFAQSVSLAPGAATAPPPPPFGPCPGNFSPDGDIFDPAGLGPVTIPMGPVGCGLAWPGAPPPTPANVNAFSSGLAPIPGGLPLPVAAASLLFSVDGVATGSGGPFKCSPLTPVFPASAADVNSEAGLLPFSSDAAADWFLASTHVLGPLPGVEPMPHLGFADGDGIAAAPFFLPHPLGAPFGLAEPFPPGDDIDSLDFAPPGAYDFAPPGGDGVPDVPVYYSVDFATAAAAGISAADVLVTVAGASAVYSVAPALGLDIVGGPGSDDIDALIVVDALADGLYDPTIATGPDIVYYSLAPGSASIGTLDACIGLPIEEGDVLGDGTLVGVPGMLCIVLPAENTGLFTARACGVNPVTGFAGDNVNAVDFTLPLVITTTTTSSTTTSSSTTSSSTTTTGGGTTTTSSTTTTLPVLCGPAPEPDVSCRLADASGAGKSSLGIKDKSPDTKDSLKWKWNKGAATVTADFKSPDVGTATYRVCVYDGTGKLLEMDLPPGGVVPVCDGKPCWKATGTKGFKYKNKTGAGSGGITGAKLKEGAAGKSQVQIKAQGKGGFYSSPATGTLVTDVVVQLLIDDGITTECFKTAFPGSSGAGAVKKQDAQTFKAKGP